MNKSVLIISLVISIVLINSGISIEAQTHELMSKALQLQVNNLKMKQQIGIKQFLPKQAPISILKEYGFILNQVRLLGSYSETNMNVQLDKISDSEDISSQFENAQYKSVKGLKVRIVVDKFSKETNWGVVLNAIYLLEKNTDFISTEISKDNNNFIVKGEVYGV